MTDTVPEIVQESPEDRQRQMALLGHVDNLLDTAGQAHANLMRMYAQLGAALLEVRNTRAWMHRDHHSWNAYLKEASERFGRGRTALYGYVSVAEQLLPIAGHDDLVRMGVTKASALAQFVKTTGRRPSDELMQAALDNGVRIEDFQNQVHEEGHIFPAERGKWHTLGFFADDSEWLEIKQAIECAKGVDPAIPNDMPEPAQVREVLLRFCREFVSTYGGENGEE